MTLGTGSTHSECSSGVRSLSEDSGATLCYPEPEVLRVLFSDNAALVEALGAAFRRINGISMGYLMSVGVQTVMRIERR